MVLGWLFALLFLTSVAQAGAILENQFTLELGGETVNFYPDSEDPYHYYYLPLKPRISTKKHGSLGEVPQFQFLKYNFDTKNNTGSLVGGILQMALTVSLPSKLLDEAKTKIAKQNKLKKAKRVTIGMIDIAEANLKVDVAQDGKFATSPLGQSPSIRHAGEIAAVNLELNPEGVAVYEKLMTGSAGLKVSYSYAYQGITPEIDVKVIGNWDKVYDHYSKSEQARKKANYLFWKEKSTENFSKVANDLRDNAGVEIVWNKKPDTTKPGGKELIKLIEETILIRIMDAVFTKEAPADNEKSVAQAQASSSGGWFGGNNSASNVKRVNKRRTGRITFRYKERRGITAPKITSENFVSVKPASEAIKKMMFVEVEKDDFFNTLRVNILAPNINPSPYGLMSLKYIITGGGATQERLYVLNRARNGLVSVEEEEERFTSLYFANPRDKYRISYHVEVTTQQGIQIKTLYDCKKIDLPNNGTTFIDFTPEKSGITFVKVDASELIFREDAEDDDDLEPDKFPKYIKGKLKQGKRKLRFKIADQKSSVFWPVCVADDTPAVKARIFAKGYKEKPRKRQYIYNDQDLSKLEDGLSLDLLNENFVQK